MNQQNMLLRVHLCSSHRLLRSAVRATGVGLILGALVAIGLCFYYLVDQERSLSHLCGLAGMAAFMIGFLILVIGTIRIRAARTGPRCVYLRGFGRDFMHSLPSFRSVRDQVAARAATAAASIEGMR